MLQLIAPGFVIITVKKKMKTSAINSKAIRKEAEVNDHLAKDRVACGSKPS